MTDIKQRWHDLTHRNAEDRSEKPRRQYGWHHFTEHFFDTGNPRYLSGFEMFAILIICSIIGYCIEMVFGRITNGYWEQSLVYGPFGLAYGIGGLLLTLLLFRDTKTPLWKVFLKSFVVLTFAEYIMSLGMELVFGHVAWDYSQMPLNIGGRVCLPCSGASSDVSGQSSSTPALTSCSTRST